MSDVKYPEIPVVVIDSSYSTHDAFSLTPMGLGPSTAIASGKPFIAMCITNPQIRASGATEEDAVKGLKILLKDHIGRNRRVTYTTISFDDELVEEVMQE